MTENLRRYKGRIQVYGEDKCGRVLEIMDLEGQTSDGSQRLQKGMLEWAGRKGAYNGWLGARLPA